MAKRIVTIDGPAGVGKSTMAKQLARELAIPYLDTGAMFRAIAWKLGEGSWEWDEARLDEALASFDFSLSGVGEDSVLALNGVPIGAEIRTEEVGMWASNVATLPVIRSFLKTAQQSLGERFSLVAEGRDMGTVIFPDATHKFFLDATVEERARRRYRQLQEMGKDADLELLKEQIAKRDDQDRNRAVAPLKAADDAVTIDTTTLTIPDVFQALVDGVQR
ncbi:Cytidylate kinase [Pseudodesulfovibrio profundus]|uniref:Cytidylate kinase n=1 Tax=Pseudodesulfovibrio profundus TaxID=57320 RepID=A0A2C8F912_9BACT|nr:(d)CMP kinase [Pseudodesulfovibrio profundus]MBC16151.1 cytidylate kinase [Desulfovibrio sp.]SOB58532.1 Cytidylate kinase [Pseudodesulfovibrio profundus]|tara:strand:- start:501 stop:1160 length:660 start_codon:yes stop_codon:yes gene_type:complete